MFFFAGIFTTIFGSLLQKKILAPRSVVAFKKVVALAMVQTILQYFFFYGGLTRCPGVKSSVILATNVFASLLIAALLFKQEKLSFLKILGCVVGFVGVVLVTVAGKSVDYHISFGGEGFIFMSSLCYGFSGCLMKAFSRDENTVMLSGWQFAFGGAVMWLFGAVCGGSMHLNAKAWGILLYLSFVSAAAYSLWAVLLKHNPVSKVTVFGFLNPLCGVIISGIVLHESGAFTWQGMTALFLVCIGIFTVNFEKKGTQIHEAS